MNTKLIAALQTLGVVFGPSALVGWQTNNPWFGLALFLFQMHLLILAQCYGRKVP